MGVGVGLQVGEMWKRGPLVQFSRFANRFGETMVPNTE